MNPITKMIEDKKRIEECLKQGKPLSSLEGIKFVQPIDADESEPGAKPKLRKRTSKELNKGRCKAYDYLIP